jgi:hypothetical protein
VCKYITPTLLSDLIKVSLFILKTIRYAISKKKKASGYNKNKVKKKEIDIFRNFVTLVYLLALLYRVFEPLKQKIFFELS